jgi:tetratricopeptide (TPR) repeat protein
MGRHTESLAEAKRSQELDPLDLRQRAREGTVLYFARRYDEAIQTFDAILKLSPDDQASLIYRAYSYSGKGMYQEAVADYQRIIKADPSTSASTQCFLGYALAQLGKKSEAQAILEKLKTTKEYVSPAEFAILYVGLGDKEGAIALLEKAYAAHDLQMQYLKIDPHYDSLRSDPRFNELLRKVGLPQ